MASNRSFPRGSTSARRGARQGRDGRGRRNFPEDYETTKYQLRNTQSRNEGFTNYFTEPSESFEVPDDCPQGKPSKEIYKGNPKNKNTHIEFFWRTESPFSQFHSAFFKVNREKYVCAEQYMMSNKARLFEDNTSLINIMNASDPRKMKKYGREVKDFDPDIWKMCCRQYVQEGNIAKFSQSPKLLNTILLTEDKYFAEASPSDRIWGIGMAESNPLAANPDSWKGSNWLGQALNLVKYEFQMIIFFTLNKESIDEIPKPSIYDLFKVGTDETFEKMNCEILISDDKGEAHTVVSKQTKFHQIKKKGQTSKTKVGSGEIKLAANFDVQLPSNDEIETQSADETSETIEQTPEHDKKKKSPSTKRKSSPNMEVSETFPKEKFKFQKVAYDSNPDHSNIPTSKRTAVEYIFIDWARLRILNDISILKCFMQFTYEELHEFPGNCTYQTKNEVITPAITISSVLIKLQKEFNNLEHLFAGQTDLIKDFDCATNIPVFPIKIPCMKDNFKGKWLVSKQDKSPKRKGKISSKGQGTLVDEDSQISLENISDAEKSPVNRDEPIQENPELLEQDKSMTRNVEILTKESDIPTKGEPETSQKGPDKSTAEKVETSQKEPDKSTAEKVETSQKGPDKSTAEKVETSQKEPDKSTAEKAEILQKEPDKSTAEKAEILQKEPDKSTAELTEISPMELGSSTDPGNAESSSSKPDKFTTGNAESGITAIMDVTPPSSPDQDQIEEKQMKRKSKKKKKSNEQQDDDTDSAKRYKNDSEQPPTKPCTKLVSYVYSSFSDEESPDNNDQTGETRIHTKSGKKHSSKESSPEMKRAKSEIESGINLESVSPVETGEVKEKPIELGTEKDSSKGKKKKKKYKKM